MPEMSFFGELRKRKVFQVAAIYGAVAWGVTEGVVTIVSQLFLPQWVATLAVIGFVVGFPIAMFLAWTFDITADGIQRTAVTSRKGKASIAGAMLLLVSATAGLFLLIRPALQDQQRADGPASVLPNSIAVLTFDNVGNNPDDAYLTEGFSDELRDQLGRMPGLRIAARSSSVSVREKATDAVSMSAALGVANLVEGSFRRRGKNLRISVQLIEGSTGLALWSESFDRKPDELLIVQQAIADSIVHKVLPNADAVVAEPATRVASANELLLLARYYEQQVRQRPEVDEDTLLEAIRFYREAIAADPESALAHSRLAGALLYLTDVEAAEAPIFQALSLNPDLSDVQTTLGSYYWARAQPGAGAAWRRAVELNPNNADALARFGYWIWMQGDNKRAEPLLRRALELDPLNFSRYGDLGYFLGNDGQVAETRDIARQVEVLFDTVPAYRLIAQLLDYTGDVDKSIAWTLRARDLEPDNADHVGALAEYFVEIGDYETAVSLDSESVGVLFKMRRYGEFIDAAEFLMIEEPNDIELRYLLGFAYTATGQHALAVRVLRSTGLPDTVLDETRQSSDLEAYFTLIQAVHGAGDVKLAKELAEWNWTRKHVVNESWWAATMRACTLSVLERDDEALAYIDRIRKSERLPRENMIRDWPCFDRYADEPRYLQMLEHFEDRRATLRARLPATLAAFGVTL